MTHDEMIAVIAAHRDGKTIQERYYKNPWTPFDGEWAFTRHMQYRIKPIEPTWLDVALFMRRNRIKSWAHIGSVYLMASDDTRRYLTRDFDEEFAQARQEMFLYKKSLRFFT